MIVKTKEDVIGTEGAKQGDKWHSLHLLDKADGMGVSLVDCILEAGFDMVLGYKNHFEACYCLEGEGTLEELDTGRVHVIKPGTLYAMNNHDRHHLKAQTRIRIIATFTPPLTGDEVHDADGSY
jgi:L-ectoine synthase